MTKRAPKTEASRAKEIIASLQIGEPGSAEVFDAFWQLDELSTDRWSIGATPRECNSRPGLVIGVGRASCYVARMRVTAMVLILASSVLALTGCTGSCVNETPGGGGQYCNDDMQRQVCSNMSGASFDTKPCAARGFQKDKSGTWVKAK